MCLAQGPQRSDAGEARTRGPSVSSQALYHWATALPKKKKKKKKHNLTMTYDFQQCGILTSVDSDEPVQPPLKLRNSKCCSVSSLTVKEYSSNKQRLWSDCAYVQADPRLCWSHIPHCWKSHIAAHIRKWQLGLNQGTPRVYRAQIMTELKKVCKLNAWVKVQNFQNPEL